MPHSARYCLLLFVGTCLVSTGCDGVYVPNGLPEEYRADVPGLEGNWIPLDVSPSATPHYSRGGDHDSDGTTAEVDFKARSVTPVVEIKRLATGQYKAKLEVDGSQCAYDINTYVIGSQTLTVIAGDMITKEGERISLPHPILVKLTINDGQLSGEVLELNFLRDNLNVLPHYRIEKSGDYVITATPEQLANFLVLIEGNLDAWKPSDVALTKQPNPQAGQSWFSWLWGLFVKIALYVFLGSAVAIVVKVIGWSTQVLGWSSEEADEEGRPLRAGWVDQTIRLLIMATAASREDLTLRGRERSLIKNIALSEAKRTDAPGEPNPLQPADVEAIIRGYESGVSGIGELLEFLTDAKYSPMRTRLLKRVWQIIVHDGPASEAEVGLAEQFASETGMTEAECLAISRRFRRPAPPREAVMEARSLLEVPASATAEDVKRAYRRKARDYHPDKLAGSAEHFKQLAAEHLKKLRNARDLLIASVDNSRLVAKGVGGRLVPASDLPEKVQCFSCAAIHPGTSPGEANTARCPRCFTLLYHEPDFAAELNRGSAASNPVGC